MGGSGSVYFGDSITPAKVEDKLRKAEQEALKGFKTELAGYLNGYLSENTRDTDAVSTRLDSIIQSLGMETEKSPRTVIFGGSVAKKTYVEGISDVDGLLIIDESDFSDKRPKEILQQLTGILSKKLKKDVREVTYGHVAVTITYNDGMEVQLLPAKKSGNKISIPRYMHDEWSKIDPIGFKNALTKTNQNCGNKLIPTIRLIKTINAQFPESLQLSGYHIESLAINAFKNYKDEKTVTAMLPHFFREAKQLVLSPVKDSTGQSVHVDEYLKASNSPERLRASQLMERVEKRIRNANLASSTDQWKRLLGDNE